MNSIATIKYDYHGYTIHVTNNGKWSPSLSLSLAGTIGSPESATFKKGSMTGEDPMAGVALVAAAQRSAQPGGFHLGSV